MSTSSISVLRTAMVLSGILPGDWEEPWKHVAFRAYASFTDFQYLFYLISKLVYTLSTVEQHDSLLYFVESGYESLIMICIGLQRYYFRIMEQDMLDLFKRFKGIGVNTLTQVGYYNKIANRVALSFGILVFFAHIQLIANFALSPCVTSTNTSTNCQKFIINVWVPYGSYETPRYELWFIFIFYESVIATSILYTTFILTPVLVANMIGQFREVADIFTNHVRPRYQRVLWTDQLGEFDKEMDLVEAIKKHQKILHVTSTIKKILCVIVLLKLVFMAAPMIIAAFILPRLPFGSFQFLRFILLLSIPLIELFTVCYSGEQLIFHSYMVHRAVFLNNWYKMSNQDKKLLLLVATRATRPSKLEVWPHFVPASLETFLKVCQFSYSVYSLLVVTTSTKGYI